MNMPLLWMALVSVLMMSLGTGLWQNVLQGEPVIGGRGRGTAHDWRRPGEGQQKPPEEAVKLRQSNVESVCGTPGRMCVVLLAKARETLNDREQKLVKQLKASTKEQVRTS